MAGFNNLRLGRLRLLQIYDYRLDSFQEGVNKALSHRESNLFRLTQSPPDGLCDLSVPIQILLKVI